jgi:DNA-binding NarL/FixJ family response regulator
MERAIYSCNADICRTTFLHKMKLELVKPLPVKHITVLLAENHAGFRGSLKLLVESDGDIEVVAEATNGAEAVSLTRKLHPEIVVMDIGMPLLNGLEATQQIMASVPATKVLILSANSDPAYIEHAVLLGASGYLIKQSSTHILPQAVREVIQGNSFFCAPISKALHNQCRALFGKGELLRKGTARPAFPDNSSHD